MKQRFIIAMTLTIILSTSLVVPVHAEGMARNTMGIGEAVSGGLLYNFINMENHPIHHALWVVVLVSLILEARTGWLAVLIDSLRASG